MKCKLIYDLFINVYRANSKKTHDIAVISQHYLGNSEKMITFARKNPKDYKKWS